MPPGQMPGQARSVKGPQNCRPWMSSSKKLNKVLLLNRKRNRIRCAGGTRTQRKSQIRIHTMQVDRIADRRKPKRLKRQQNTAFQMMEKMQICEMIVRIF
ncbi:uncharacterized protein LOC116614630 isoform X2 [Nematostella vectensis]|uniref:uncharacterized protein LOC116614630 isoform X2 n=1 Tax=Nematostella vectensis TaxID=45351 RepID=UPI0020778ECB|nr:uncharacterized protein LOC116614630 isoform X2 [Nematostella vectensis]